MSGAASIAARVAGAVTALGFVLGVVDGPVVGLVGALALLAFGRSLVTPAGTELLGPLAFAVVAGATGVVALRWSSLDLTSIRGTQAVLGPTVAVDPTTLAAACGVAFVAGVIAAGVWLADDLPGSGLSRRWWWIEIVTAGVVLATLFAGPEPAGMPEIGIWGASIAATVILTAGIGRILRARSAGVKLTVIASAGVLVAGAAGVVGSIA